MQEQLTPAEALAALPWSWQGPSPLPADEGPGFELRITELPDFFVAGATKEETLREAVPALVAFLESYVQGGQQPPLPAEPALWHARLMALPAPSRTVRPQLILQTQ
jgi:predicted RNase H-like HicB family nuclease